MSKSPTPLAPDQILRLSWTHLIELLRLDDPWKRAFYENECLRGNWSVRHLQSFLLELGSSFCFEARQKRITVGNEHEYIDLVFYHRRLRCHLLIDLKVRAFRHGGAGQMNFYLNYWKANELEEGDNPPIGLLLCSGKDATKVEYATAGLDRQVFVSRYLVALPSPAQLRDPIEADRAALESNGTRATDAPEENT